jgi:ABC-type multidrug transport system ATPase subunit
MAAVINVEGLTKQFGNLRAVNNLSFKVNDADVYGFLGQNGAGKSTTIRMLLTLIQPSSGSIELFGMNLYTHRKEILRKVGAVIERPDLYKYMTAYDNLLLFARMSGIKPTRPLLMQQLEMVGLAERAHSKVKTYSQGMKQRLGIAVALVHNPDLIILDEPTNGLDPQGIADIRNLILHLSRNMKKTVVVSSHLLSEIEQVATRMIIIDKGTKITEGSVAALFDAKNTEVAIEVIEPDFALSVIQNSQWQNNITQHHLQNITLKMDKAAIPLLNSHLVKNNVSVLSINAKNSLENYFLSLTGNNQHVATFEN